MMIRPKTMKFKLAGVWLDQQKKKPILTMRKKKINQLRHLSLLAVSLFPPSSDNKWVWVAHLIAQMAWTQNLGWGKFFPSWISWRFKKLYSYFRYRRQRAPPEINDNMQFPTLQAASQDPGKKEGFTSVANQTLTSQNRTTNQSLSTSNKFTAFA